MEKFNHKKFDNWIKDEMYNRLKDPFLPKAKTMSPANLDYLYEITCNKLCFSQTSETRKIFNEIIQEA